MPVQPWILRKLPVVGGGDVRDVKAPVLSTIEVGAVADDKIVLTYDELLDTTSVPATGDFSLGGTSETVSSVGVSGAAVTLTLSGDLLFGVSYTVDYTAGSNPIRDLALNNATNLTGQAVTNTVAMVSEYQAVYDSFTTKPSEELAEADNLMVETIVDAGLWSEKLDIFDVLAMDSNGDGESLKNWIAPGTYNPTLVNAPAFVSLEGFTGNGSTSYIDLNYNPGGTGTFKYTLNDCCIAAYIRTNVQENLSDLGADETDDSTRLTFMSRSGTDKFFIRVNSSAYDGGYDVTDSRALWAVGRDDSITIQLHKNGGKVRDVSVDSVALQNANIFACGRNDGAGSPEHMGTKQISLIYAGKYLTPAENLIIYNAFQTRMATLGKEI